MPNDARFTPGCTGGFRNGRWPAISDGILRRSRARPRRHRGQRGDRHQQADGQATARRQAASAVPRKRTPERWAAVEDRLRAGGSPEPIAGRYRQQGEVMAGKEWIYQYVRADRQAGGTRYRCRRRRGQKPNGRGGRHAGRGQIPDRVHTGTADHGKEFARPREIAPKLDAGFTFATPYHSWERGLNEHTNGLVRQYFPKGTDFRQVTAAQVRAVEDRLHRRPRKVLGYRTPAAVFARGLAPPGRGRRSLYRPLPGTPVTRRSGLARPHGAGFALALADDFGPDRRPSRWLSSGTEKKRSTREFFGCRRDPSLYDPPRFAKAIVDLEGTGCCHLSGLSTGISCPWP